MLWTGEWHLPLTTLRTVTFPLVRQIYSRSDAIAVYGPHIREYLSNFGVAEEKISIAWNTVDTDKFENFDQADVARLRERWNIADDAVVIMFVGRLVAEKGIKYLIDAYEEAQEKTDRETCLLIVGDGDRPTELTQRADGIQNVVFTGYVNNDGLPEYYALADTFVLPSIITAEFREPWGLVVNEAMSSGTPVITTGQVGAANIIENGENGFIVPERNVENLTDRLIAIFENPEIAMKLGERAKKDIQAYDYERMFSGLDHAVQTALKRSDAQ